MKSNTKQSNSLLPEDEDFSLDGLTLTDKQRMALKKLDMANQLSIIKKLREEQGIERPKAKAEVPQTSPSELDILREKVDKANREIKIADNKHSGTKTDANHTCEQKNEELEVDYSKYGKDFSKKFINELVSDNEFNKIVKDYLTPNEGGYNNDEDDSGGETNMGISKTTHKNEDIKNMTRERANAIFYRDYYKWNGIYKLPYKIRGFVVDFGVVSYPLMAIKMTHRVLGIPEGNIIGDTTLDKLKKFTQKDYENFLKKYKSEMIKYFHAVAENDPTKKKFLKGWIDRAKRAHLAE